MNQSRDKVSPKKIVFLTRFFWPHIGGVEKHVLKISKILAKEGHDITIITEKFGKSSSNRNQSDSESDKLTGKGYAIKIVRIDPGKENWFKKFRIWKELIKHLTMIQKADLVHAHDVYYWYFPFRFLFFKKHSYVTFHGYEGNKIPGKKAILNHKLAEVTSNGNICVGDFYFKWYRTNPSFIIYGAIDLEKNKPGRSKKGKVVFIGRLEMETGIMEYLKSIADLKLKNIMFKTLVLGDGSLLKKCKIYSSKNKLNVAFKGFVENIEPYLEEAEIVFTSRYLGILEAMAGKKKVFAVYNSEIKKDYLQMTPFAKWINIAGNSKELTSQIEDFFKAPSLVEVEEGYRWARTQTWEKVVQTYKKLWNIDG